jgi:hypothetical protein
VAISDLYCRTAGQVSAIAVIEVLPPNVEAGLLIQVLGEPLMEGLVVDVVDGAPQLRVAVFDFGVDGRGMYTKRGSRARSLNLVVLGMPTIHN